MFHVPQWLMCLSKQPSSGLTFLPKHKWLEQHHLEMGGTERMWCRAGEGCGHVKRFNTFQFCESKLHQTSHNRREVLSVMLNLWDIFLDANLFRMGAVQETSPHAFINGNYD